MSERYNIVRCYFKAGIRKRIIRRNVTLEEAQKHCGDPESSSEKCTTKVGKARTKKIGKWFDAYDSE